MKKREKFLRLSEVCLKVGLKSSELRALEAKGRFPSRVYLSSERPRWLLSEVQQFMQEKISFRNQAVNEARKYYKERDACYPNIDRCLELAEFPISNHVHFLKE